MMVSGKMEWHMVWVDLCMQKEISMRASGMKIRRMATVYNKTIFYSDKYLIINTSVWEAVRMSWKWDIFVEIVSLRF